MNEPRILLVEDDPDDRLLILRALRKNGLGDGVEVVGDGAAALEYLLGADEQTGRPPAPQLVLLKRKLPRVDGHEVLRRLRSDERTRSLSVVLMVYCEEEGDDLGARCPLADGYLCRTVDFAGFSRRVRRLKPLLGDA